jgi:tetratricopeptide (TPR) repeat protein
LGIAERYEALVTGNWERVREVSDEWNRTYPRDPQPYVGLALAHQAAGQFEEALAASRKAIAADADFVPGYMGVAEAEIELNHPADVEEAMRRAMARGLQSDEFFVELYTVAFLRGDQTRMSALAAAPAQLP